MTRQTTSHRPILRAVLALMAIFTAISSALPAFAQAAQVTTSADGDITLGSPRAKVVLVEYGAPTCPYCKQWHDEIYVRIKQDYIDTGKIRFAFRELPSHNPPVDAAIFGIARCAGPEKFFSVIDDAFRRQADIDRASGSPEGPGAQIGEIAKASGLPADKAMACLDAPSLTERLDAVRAMAIRDRVEGTPTLVLAGRLIEDGYDDYAQLRALIDKAIAAAH